MLEIDPQLFEILVARELRKVGIDVAALRRRRAAPLNEEDDGSYELRLAGSLRAEGAAWRVVVACQRRADPVPAEVVDRLHEEAARLEADGALLFALPDFDPDAVRRARACGIPLLRVVDGRTAWDGSGWGTPGQYPAWLPEHTAEAVVTDAAGLVRYAPLEAGGGAPILEPLRIAAARAEAARAEAGGGR